jgi:DNA-binding CsgD family transcriptional regulator/tetratricopeptide (TPR) repeat protein
VNAVRLTRPRLNERLARAAQFPIVVIVAPAGYGKSIALRDFLSAGKRHAVRFDVRREEGSLLAFARRLSEALEPLIPSVSAAFGTVQEQALSAAQPERLLCDWFGEHLKDAAATIAVDDLHFAAGQATAFLVDLIERTCDRTGWIVASRTDAGLPVATWLAYQRMDAPVGENELRFTFEEAWDAAQSAGSSLSRDELQSLYELTEGWPVALTIAVRTHTQAAQLREAATRELIYRYLAEQVFTHLSAAQREFLLATSIFASFDAGMAQTLGADAAFLAELRHGAAFLTETAPGQFRYHDLFRDYLESELLRRGAGAWRRALAAGAQVLEDRGDDAAALTLYTKAQDANAILRIVENNGFTLFERGQADALAAALRAVPEALRRTSAAALGLQATIEAARGLFDPACRGFVSAIERADRDDLRLTLVHRYAIELVRQGMDCVALLEQHVRDERVPAALRVPLMGTLATAYVRTSRANDALETIQRALQLVDPVASDDVRARLYQQAAYVYNQESKYDLARRYALLAVELAIPCNLYDVALRSYSVLYQVAYDEDDDPTTCLAILDKLLDCARKAASRQGLLFGLMASYGIEADRGDEAALARIEKLLDDIPGTLPQSRSDLLVPMAVRIAWHGDFRRACETLSRATEQPNDEWRAEHFSTLALFACAAGLRDQTHDAVAAASAALARWGRPTRGALFARLQLAFTELARGRAAPAYRHLSAVKRDLDPQMRRLAALAHAATVFYRCALGQADQTARSAALERLRLEQFGGMARLLEVIPFSPGTAGGYAALTATEREILALLAAGKSTREMADRTARSPRTIDTHVRTICKKLNCHSRRAAVALAIGSGWVQNEG